MNVLLFLGAGFSKEAGLPLQKDFHEHTQRLRQLPSFLEYYRGISAAYYLAQYLTNKDWQKVTLEDAFGALEYTFFAHRSDYKVAYLENMLDSHSFVKSSKGIPIGDARRGFLMALETVFRPKSVNPLESYENMDLYKLFFEKILHKTGDLKIITTNYDLVCENALKLSLPSGSPRYPDPFSFYRRNVFSVPILKLHGSVDWKETRIDPPNIIPPTWMKRYDVSDKYHLIWTEAERVINDSSLLIFIGYSMPEIDRGIQYLIRSGLQPSVSGSPDKRVIVLTKEDEIEERFRTVVKVNNVGEPEIIPMYLREFIESGKLDDILD